MSPLLHLLILTTTIASPSTHPTTIDPNRPETTHTERSTMAQGPNVSYPVRHPNQPTGRMNREDAIRAGITFPGNPGRAAHGYPTIGTNSLAASSRGVAPVEHTNRPR